ncbi:hypothetical protein MASR2M29_19960 [Spirochaetota bacterium]
MLYDAVQAYTILGSIFAKTAFDNKLWGTRYFIKEALKSFMVLELLFLHAKQLDFTRLKVYFYRKEKSGK